jgi:hypothetical protein
MKPPVGVAHSLDTPRASFPLDLNSAAGVIGLVAGYVLGMLDSGRLCSLNNLGQKPYASSKNMVELNSDMLQGLAELLQNKTATDILHNIRLPKNATEVMRLLPGDSKSRLRARLI